MNHIFRVIWNEAHNCWQAVAEFVKGHSQPGSKTPRGLRRAYDFVMLGFGKKRLYPKFSLTIGAFLVQSAFAAPPTPPAPNQLPTGGQVAAGQVAISQSGTNMQIRAE